MVSLTKDRKLQFYGEVDTGELIHILERCSSLIISVELRDDKKSIDLWVKICTAESTLYNGARDIGYEVRYYC